MKKEFGKWLMDIAKYILTAVILTLFFEDMSEKKIVYIWGGIIVVSAVIVGLYFQKETLVKKKGRK